MQRRTFIGFIAGTLITAIFGPAILRRDDSQDKLFDMVNSRRENRDRKPLKWDAELGKASQSHAQKMADNQRLFHSEIQLPEGAIWAGEIIGVGGDFKSVMKAWLDSPEHKRILLKRKARWGGAGAAKDGRWWLVVQFAY